MEPIRTTRVILASVAIAAMVASCRREDARPAVCAISPQEATENEDDIFMMETSGLSLYDKYDAMFMRVIGTTNYCRSVSLKTIQDICKEISSLEESEARMLSDRLVDMIIKQPISASGFQERQLLYEQLFYMFAEAFYTAYVLRGRDFEYWGKMFEFLDKYTEEIKTLDRQQQKKRGQERYIIGLREDLKMWVHLIRDCYLPRNLGEGLTDAQKMDIIGRFNELERRTIAGSASVDAQ